MVFKMIKNLLVDQRGIAMPMALLLMAAAAFVVMPGLSATGSLLTISRNLEDKTKAYYSSEAGIAYSLWKFKQSAAEPSFPLVLNNINGGDVQLNLLKHEVAADNSVIYTVQAATVNGFISSSRIVVKIKKGGDQGNNLFDQAVVSLNGDISLSGGCNIFSDDVKIIDYCDSAWTQDKSQPSKGISCSSVSSPRETNVFYDKGNSAEISIKSAAVVGKLAYKDISTVNLSSYKYVSLWIYSSVPLNAGDIYFIMATGSTLSGNIVTINIPAIAANTGTRIKLDIPDPSLFSTLNSIGVAQAVDKGAFDLFIDNVLATNSISNGDIYANGNINIEPSAQVFGNASATGAVNVNTGGGAKVWGSQMPSAPPYVTQLIDTSLYYQQANIKGGTVYQNLNLNWNSGDLGQITVNNDMTVNWSSYTVIMGPAWIGHNLTISTDKIVMGPVYVGNDLYIGGSSQVTLKGTVWVGGKLTIANGAYIQGPYTIVANSIVISGSAQVELVRGNVPFLIALGTTGEDGNVVNITGSASTSAIIYAPNGTVSITGGVGANGYNVYGSVVAKNVVMAGSTGVKYLTGLRTMPWDPGWGLGPGPGSGSGLGGKVELTAYDFQ